MFVAAAADTSFIIIIFIIVSTVCRYIHCSQVMSTCHSVTVRP